jgi:hypothetical protein
MIEPTPNTAAVEPSNRQRVGRSGVAANTTKRMKSINRFSADHDWSRWFTYKLIREGHLKVVQVFGRKRITEADEQAFDDAVASGLLVSIRK